MAAERFPVVRSVVRRRNAKPLAWVLIIAAGLGLAACGGEPLHPSKWKEPPGEIPEGSGLLTGEEGEWELLPQN